MHIEKTTLSKCQTISGLSEVDQIMTLLKGTYHQTFVLRETCINNLKERKGS